MNHVKSVSLWVAGVLAGGFLVVGGCVSSQLAALGTPVKATGTISLDVDDDFRVTKLVLIAEDAKSPDYEILLDDKSDPLTGMFGTRVEVTGKMGKVKRRPVLVLDSYKVLEP
jgi:hypothetical protein